MCVVLCEFKVWFVFCSGLYKALCSLMWASIQLLWLRRSIVCMFLLGHLILSIMKPVIAWLQSPWQLSCKHGGFDIACLNNHKSYAGLSLDILKMESWTHMGRTANIIIKDVINIFASVSKFVRILLMGWRNRKRWYACQILNFLNRLPFFNMNWMWKTKSSWMDFCILSHWGWNKMAALL